MTDRVRARNVLMFGWTRRAVNNLIGMPMPDVQHTMLCPGYCGYQVSVQNNDRSAAWDQLSRHLLRCARGYAVAHLMCQAIAYAVEMEGCDHAEYYSTAPEWQRQIWDLPRDKQPMSMLRAMYVGEGQR